MAEPRRQHDPRDEPIYRAILTLLVASVLAGAVLTLAGEALTGNRALAHAGLGMALVCGLLYWVFRLLGRRAARRAAARRGEQGGGNGEGR
jgi:high-affinity Fe2+/Pb2+ permease